MPGGKRHVCRGPRRPAPIIFSPCRPPTRRLAVWLKTVLARRNVSLVCRSLQQQSEFCRVGIWPDQCQVIRPGVVPAASDPVPDQQLRDCLGIADDDHVLFAPGESTIEANHELAVWVASILHVLDPRYKLLLWGRGPRSARAGARGSAAGPPEPVPAGGSRSVAEGGNRPSNSRGRSGAALTAGPSASTLGLGLCMAAGLPIVATETPDAMELLQEGKSALMTAPGAARLLAQRIVELRENSDLARAWDIRRGRTRPRNFR